MISATLTLSAAVEAIGFSQNVGDPALDGGQCQLGVGRRRRGDHDSVDPRRQQLLDRISRLRTVFRGDCRNELGPLVGDDEPVDAVKAARVSVWKAPMRPSPITPSVVMAFSDRLGRAARHRVVLG